MLQCRNKDSVAVSKFADIQLICPEQNGWNLQTTPSRGFKKKFLKELFYGLAQDCGISSALAMEILQPCTKPSISVFLLKFQFNLSMVHSTKCHWHCTDIMIWCWTNNEQFLENDAFIGHQALVMLIYKAWFTYQNDLFQITNLCTMKVISGLAYVTSAFCLTYVWLWWIINWFNLWHHMAA